MGLFEPAVAASGRPEAAVCTIRLLFCYQLHLKVCVRDLGSMDLIVGTMYCMIATNSYCTWNLQTRVLIPRTAQM